MGLKLWFPIVWHPSIRFFEQSFVRDKLKFYSKIPFILQTRDRSKTMSSEHTLRFLNFRFYELVQCTLYG